MWLLLAIVLNLQTVPPQVHHVEIVGTFSSERDCVIAQKELLAEYKPFPDTLNIGCLPLKNHEKM